MTFETCMLQNGFKSENFGASKNQGGDLENQKRAFRNLKK